MSVSETNAQHASSHLVMDAMASSSRSRTVPRELPLAHSPKEKQTDSSDLTLGKCQCCSSELRYPSSVSRFRCPICDTINDLKPHVRHQPNQPITLRQLKRCIYDCKQEAKRTKEENRERIFAPVATLVETVFGSWLCLNHSFSNGNEPTMEDSGLAMDDVGDAYRILLNLPVNVIRAMMAATDQLLKRPAIPLRRLRDIRFLLIILENPLLAQHNFPAESKYHHNLLKRVYGMLSCLNNECHHALVNWFTIYAVTPFSKQVNLAHTFISYRITKARRCSLGMPAAYASDWKLASVSRVMALLFAANQKANKVSLADFYNTMVDTIDLMNDFDTWQSRSGQFAFCQYPLLISMGSKMQIMEQDAKQQMESKWREAFFSMLFHQKASLPYLVLRVRREYLIEDSLRQLAHHEYDLKKSLRIQFIGEEGVDAGGLRKEWFLLLVRSLFDPQYGMFTYDDDSNQCWFNPSSFENEDQFFLVGIVLGLAIYNSTILDIHLPIACFKKLLNYTPDVNDLGEFRPALKRGLDMLLEFDGDVEDVFCRMFVVDEEVFGERRCVPLIKNGESIAVTNANRDKFVELYADYILNKSVERQFGAFRRGFYYVCGGNALSLFRPEEIELLVHGSDQALDIDELRCQTEYDGFDEKDETIVDFWDLLTSMSLEMQRKLLMFVTGSDRIPATGATHLRLRITCGGEDCDRLPTAHTCFNQLVIYRYHARDKLKRLLETAILESQGFYVK